MFNIVPFGDLERGPQRKLTLGYLSAADHSVAIRFTTGWEIGKVGGMVGRGAKKGMFKLKFPSDSKLWMMDLNNKHDNTYGTSNKEWALLHKVNNDDE